MIQIAQTASIKPMASSPKVSIPVMYARHIINATSRTTNNREAVETVLSLQKDMHARCCKCGEKWPATFMSRSYARRVCNLARSIAFHELVQELKKRLHGRLPQCPRCGHADDDLGREAVN